MSPHTAKPACHTEQRVASRMPSAYYTLHALLQTLRQFGQHEDQICSLLHQMERTGKVSPQVTRELQQLLGDLPLFSLENELEALAESLAPVAA